MSNEPSKRPPRRGGLCSCLHRTFPRLGRFPPSGAPLTLARVSDPNEEDAPEDLLPPGMFLASMPWWVLRDDAAAGYVVLAAADGGTCLAVFTDEDLADRFAVATGFAGRAVAAGTPGEFLALLAGVPPVCTY